MTGGASDSGVQAEIEQFLYREARLLDERLFRAWLGLFAADARYSVYFREMSQRRESTNPREKQLLEDDWASLELRVQRLETRLAHAEQPASYTRHLVTNIEVETGEVDGEFLVRANLMVYQARVDIAQQVFYGCRQDRVRKVGSDWQIASRKVVLDTSVVPRTITIFF